MKGNFPSLYFLYIPASNSLDVCIFLPLISTQAFVYMEERRPRHSPPPPRGPYPWLVFDHGRGLRNQTFYTISHSPSNQSNNNNSSVRSVPELRNNNVYNSCHGWLILSNEDDQFSLFNPVTLESILLPPHDKLDPKTHINACALSSPPADPSCALFLFDSGLRRILCCRLENQVWFEKSYGKVIEAVAESSARRKNYLHSPVSCNGKLYATTYYGGQLVSIDTTEQSTSDLFIRPLGTSLPSDYEPLSQWAQLVLVESGGELFTIVTMGAGRLLRQVVGIQIFKLDWTSVTWERGDNAKGRAFFLCNRYAISCPATDPDQVRGNCVYFPGYNDRDLCMYDIADGSISLLLPCLNLSTPWTSPFWVMPDLR